MENTSDECQMTNRQVLVRLLRFAWNYRTRCIQVLSLQLLLLLFGLFGLGLTGVGIDYLHFALADDVTPPGIFGYALPANGDPLPVLLWISGGIIFLAIIRAGINYACSMSVAKLVQGEIVVDLRRQIYDKLQVLSFRFFDRNSSGSIINRVTGDVQ